MHCKKMETCTSVVRVGCVTRDCWEPDRQYPPHSCSALEFTSDELLVLMQALRLLENAQRLVSILPARCPKAAGLDALKLANRLNEEFLHRHESWAAQNASGEGRNPAAERSA